MSFNPILRQLSNIIDIMIIKYYNFQLPDYSNYTSIFLASTTYPGSTVKDIIQLGLLPNQIIVGKPSSTQDSYTTNFYVQGITLQLAFSQAYN